MTATEQILAHMHKLGRITPAEAFERYGCYRLAARIFDLRCQGHQITTVRMKNDPDNQNAPGTCYVLRD